MSENFKPLSGCLKIFHRHFPISFSPPKIWTKNKFTARLCRGHAKTMWQLPFFAAHSVVRTEPCPEGKSGSVNQGSGRIVFNGMSHHNQHHVELTLRPFNPPRGVPGPFGPKVGNGVENEFLGLPAPGSRGFSEALSERSIFLSELLALLPLIVLPLKNSCKILFNKKHQVRWWQMSGRRTSATSRPSLGAQVLALFSFISWVLDGRNRAIVIENRQRELSLRFELLAFVGGHISPQNTEISPHRLCVRCAAIRIARLASTRLTFVPNGTAEWFARVDCVR